MKTSICILTFYLLLFSLLQAQDTIKVNSGWNMIGGASKQARNGLTTVPPGIIISSFFGYQAGIGYSTIDTLCNGGGYWVKTNQAGFIFPANQLPSMSSTPTPVDDAIGVSLSPILNWSCSDHDNDPLTYDVYFGIDNPPLSRVSSGQSSTFLTRNGLNNNTTYFWKVVSKDSHNDSAISPVWQFITSEFINQPPAIPFNPVPTDNTTDVSISSVVLWSCSDPDNDPLTYDVYLGTDNPPTTKISSAQNSTYVSFSGLSNSAQYYWRVIAKDNHIDSTTGPVWRFTTVAAQNQPPAISSNPFPADNDTSVLLSHTLHWNCSDLDGDPLTYDVYFGTDNPPVTIVSSGQTGTSLSRSGLSHSIHYYWKVVAHDSHGASTSSPVWSYTTTAWVCTNQVSYLGRTYNTVQIGTQCWFKENLDAGTQLVGFVEQTNNSVIEKYCYNDVAANCNTYGGLYEWGEVMQYSTSEGAQGICPIGWHIPTYAEFLRLDTAVAFNANALKAVGQGSGYGTGTNTSGFSALLAGWRWPGGYFDGITTWTYYWSSTFYISNPASVYTYSLEDINNHNGYGLLGWNNGYSVRCLHN